MYIRRPRGNTKVKYLEKGITGKLDEQNMKYSYIEGKHGGMSDDWEYYLRITQEYKSNHDVMMNFVKGYNDHERR